MTLTDNNDKKSESESFGTPNIPQPAKPPIFIFGCVRSGTSLLSSMLNAHPNIVCPRETAFFLQLERYAKKNATSAAQFWSKYKAHKRFKDLGVDHSLVDEYLENIPNPDFNHVLDGVMHAVLTSANKSRWCEKTPGHERFFRQIANYYPESPILFLVRDPRAVCLSIKKVSWGNESAYVRLKRWNKSARILNKISDFNNVRLVKYEHLVQHASEELEKICEFIGERFDKRMIDDRATAFDSDRAEFWKSHENQKDVLGSVYTTSIKKWKDDLDKSEIRIIEVCCGRMMKKYGYEPVTSTSPLKKVTLRILLGCGFFFRSCAAKLRSVWSSFSKAKSAA